MKTFITTKLQEQLSERLAAAGFAGTWWGPTDEATRFYFGKSAEIRKGDKVQKTKVWLQFDDAATLEGVSLKCQAPKRWLEVSLAESHAPAVIIAIELIDPEEAAKLREEISHAERVGDLVCNEEDD